MPSRSTSQQPPSPGSASRRRRAASNTGAQLERELGERLAIRERRRVPYLYRYVSRGVSDDARGAELAAYVLAAEQRRISEGRLVPVGLRLIADRA